MAKYVINPFTGRLDQTVGPNDQVTGGGAPGTAALYISNTTPATSETKYLWIQTGLGTSNTDITFWVEDGQ